MKRTLSALSAAVIGSLAAPVSVIAAEGDGVRRIEEVIVTAERQEASVSDTSISITALTSDFMEDFGIRNQSDFAEPDSSNGDSPIRPFYSWYRSTVPRIGW